MKFIKHINEFLSSNKSTYVKWLSNDIIKEIRNNGIKITNFLFDYDELVFEISDTSDINVIFKILNKRKKHCLESDNILIVIDYDKDIDELNFKLNFKSIIIKRIKPLKYVYHQTTKDNLESILKFGLIPTDSSKAGRNVDLDYPPLIFCSNVNIDNHRLFYDDYPTDDDLTL